MEMPAYEGRLHTKFKENRASHSCFKKSLMCVCVFFYLADLQTKTAIQLKNVIQLPEKFAIREK